MLSAPAASLLAPLVIILASAFLLVLFVVAVRLFGPRFVDYHGVVAVDEPPITAIDRVQRAVEAQRNYTFRRVGADRIEVIHSSVRADEHATKLSPPIAGVALDRLVATAAPVATGTEVTLIGRAEPRLINAVRSELGHARMPRLQRPVWKSRDEAIRRGPTS